MNQAEVVHVSWANRDNKKLSLLDCAHMDTRDSVLLEAQLKEYKEGRDAGGKGPSFKDRNFRKEIDRAVRCGREVNELVDKIDGTSGHRPKEDRKRKKGKDNTKKKNKKSNPPVGTSLKHYYCLKHPPTALTLQHSLPPYATVPQHPCATTMQNPLAATRQPPPYPYATTMQNPLAATDQLPLHPFATTIQNPPAATMQHLRSTGLQPPQLPCPNTLQQQSPTGNCGSALRYPGYGFPHPYSTPPPTNLGLHPNSCNTASSAPTSHSNIPQHPRLPMTPMWHSGLSPHNYELVVLPTNVKKCYRCGQEFAAKYKQHPNNIVTKHCDRRITGKDLTTGILTYASDFTNTYYHLSLQHIRRKNPLFTGLISLPSNVYTSLSDAQKQVLAHCDLNIQFI